MSAQAPADLLLAVLLSSVRIVAWMSVAPPFSSRAVPASVRALVSVALALPVVHVTVPQVPPAEPGPLLVALVLQVVVGGGLGFLCYLGMVAFQSAGDLLDISGGFALGAAFDPLMQSLNSVLGRFYSLLATTLLLVSGAWLVVWRGLLASFRLVPLDGGLDTGAQADVVTAALGELLLVALQIAGPLLAVLFVADAGLALAARIAPQLNALATGFPLKILLTVLLIGLSLTAMPQAVVGSADRVVLRLGEVLAVPGWRLP